MGESVVAFPRATRHSARLNHIYKRQPAASKWPLQFMFKVLFITEYKWLGAWVCMVVRGVWQIFV